MRTFLFLMLVSALWSCQNSPAETDVADADAAAGAEQPEEVAEAPEAAEPVPVNPEFEALLGYYVGDFEAKKVDSDQNYSYVNRINIQIMSMGDGKISGRSIVAGNDRPFSGTYTRPASNAPYEVTVKEPGDDRYDGTFYFNLDSESSQITGTWVANDAGLAVPEREYVLQKRTFSYDPNLELPESVGWADLYNGEHPEEYSEVMEFLTEEVLRFNPSVVQLKKEDVENMYKGDLEVMRNSIYARHGYSFRNRKMRYIFDRYVDWYIPVSTDVRSELTAVEKANIDLIKRYEEHSEKYYDSFGR